MKKLNNKKQNWNKEEKEKINKLMNNLIIKLIKPLIKEETNLDILKIINRSLAKEENFSKIFSCSNNIFNSISNNIINL